MVRRLVLAGVGSLGIATVIAFGVNATSWQTATALTNCSTSTEGMDGDETNVAIQINQQRASNGLPPLLISLNLNRAAAWKSADPSNTQMANFSHTDSLGRGPYNRAIDCGYPTGAGEIIALGYSASSVVTGWMNSDGHRNNILNSSYRVMGVGHAGNSWVTNFGFIVDPGAYSVGSPAPPQDPTSTPAPPRTVGAGLPPPTQPAPGGTWYDAPPAVKTVLPGGEKPQWMLPSNVPFKRATIMMVSAE
jgi:hypothetical protein